MSLKSLPQAGQLASEISWLIGKLKGLSRVNIFFKHFSQNWWPQVVMQEWNRSTLSYGSRHFLQMFPSTVPAPDGLEWFIERFVNLRSKLSSSFLRSASWPSFLEIDFWISDFWTLSDTIFDESLSMFSSISACWPLSFEFSPSSSLIFDRRTPKSEFFCCYFFVFIPVVLEKSEWKLSNCFSKFSFADLIILLTSDMCSVAGKALVSNLFFV